MSGPRKHIEVNLYGRPQEFAIDFGRVVLDSQKYFQLKLISQLSSDVNFVIQRDKESPLLNEDVFDISPRDGLLVCRTTTTVNVCYRPRFPYEKSVDYYDIYYGSDPHCARINLLGTSEGCRIVLEPEVLEFNFETRGETDKHSERDCIRRMFMVENTSSMVAYMNFKLEPGVFCVTPRCCRVDPGARFQVQVICHRVAVKALCHFLHVLVHNGAARCVQLLISAKLSPLPLTPSLEKTPSRFWSDRLVLDMDIVDFGRTIPGSGSVCLLHATNVTAFNMQVQWFTLSTRTVVVVPDSCVVCAGKTIAFEVLFVPEEKDILYFTHIEAIVQPNDSDNMDLRTLHQFPVMGNTFAIDELAQAPSVLMSPSPLVLPACAINGISSATCLVNNSNSCQQLVYNFASSDIFRVFPQVGCVDAGDFAVVLVDYIAGKEVVARFVGSVSCRLDLFHLHSIDLQILASQESPEVAYEPSPLKFPSVCRGMVANAAIYLRNLTRCRLHITAECADGCMYPEKRELTLASNEKVAFKWRSYLDEPGFHEYVISHRIRFVSTVDAPVDTSDKVVNVTAQTNLIDGGIYTEHHEIDMGIQSVGKPVSSLVRIHNDCDILADVLLALVPHPMLNGCFATTALTSAENFSEAVPLYHATIVAHKFASIKFTVEPDVEGTLRFQLVYCILCDETGKQKTSYRSLAEVSFHSYRPFFQFADIETKQGDVFQDKLIIWKLLSINSLNSELKFSKGKSEIHMALPPRPSGSSEYTLAMLIENPGHVPAVWSFVFHANVDWFQLSSTSGKLLPSSSETILLNVQLSNVPRVDKVTGRIRVHGGSDIIVCLQRTSVSSERSWVYLPTDSSLFAIPYGDNLSACQVDQYSVRQPVIELQPIELGCRHPPLQFVTLFNSGLRSAEFHVCCEELQRVKTENWNVSVLQCLDSKGHVPAGGCARIRLVFCPVEARNYEFNLPISIDSSCYGQPVLLRARGIIKDNLHKDRRYSQICSQQQVFLPNENISLSHRYIHFGALSTRTSRTKIVYMRNHCKEYFCFMWSLRLGTDECCTVFSSDSDQDVSPNGSRVDIDPKEGLMAPEETIAVCLTFSTGDIPQVCSHIVNVAFRNLTRERLFQINYAAWKRLCERRRAEFVISESHPLGYTRPLTHPPQEPSPTYIPVTIEAHVCHMEDTLSENGSCVRQLISSADGDVASLLLPSPCPNFALLSSSKKTIIDFCMRGILWSLLQECDIWQRIENVNRDCVPFFEQLDDDATVPEPDDNCSSNVLVLRKRFVTERIIRDSVTKIIREYATDNNAS